jgi:hypothetical protein
MGLWKRLLAPQRERLDEEILTGLTENYIAERRLAKQLRAHADEAPYPHAAEHLRRLADLEDGQADRLYAEIVRRGGWVEAPVTEPGSGRNHWARLVSDLEEERAAMKRYLEQAIRWEDTDAGLGQLLRTLEREEQQHRLWLQDLIARSDPHASN